MQLPSVYEPEQVDNGSLGFLRLAVNPVGPALIGALFKVALPTGRLVSRGAEFDWLLLLMLLLRLQGSGSSPDWLLLLWL